MNQLHPDVSLVPMLERLAVGNFHYWLCFNNVASDLNRVLSDFTAGSTQEGPVLVSASDFTLTGVAAHLGMIQAAPIAINNPTIASRNCYGYFITDTTDAVLFGFGIFDSPIACVGGEDIPVTPVLGDNSKYSS